MTRFPASGADSPAGDTNILSGISAFSQAFVTLSTHPLESVRWAICCVGDKASGPLRQQRAALEAHLDLVQRSKELLMEEPAEQPGHSPDLDRHRTIVSYIVAAATLLTAVGSVLAAILH
ncbi:hypothetical protein Ait01nite_051450 [Actinoplanes italicus]|nr:hypothetical protein Ait01nite_051450 [Actinoplanes italicus]